MNVDKKVDVLDRTAISDRIKSVAKNADSLIMKLDTLSNRIDTARINENSELVEYYENQFAEASVEFMDSVETILNDWYALKGAKRPPADEETITPEMLDEIHSTVVSIVQGLSLDMSEPDRASALMDRIGSSISSPDSAANGMQVQDSSIVSSRVGRKKGPSNKVDLTG